MTAVRAGEVETALRRLQPGVVVLLLYGPDAGLVAERAKAAAERAAGNPGDPFQLVLVEGETIAADPARLSDEARTIGLFGGRRVIRVKPTTRNLGPAVEAVLSASAGDTLIVVEAGELQKAAPLRAVCEKSPKALALPCYADEGRSLGSVVDDAARAAGLTLTRDARSILLSNLGADRLTTRSELEKLTLYAHGRSEISLQDVDAVVSNVSSLALDTAIDAAFAGELDVLDAAYARLSADGQSASAVLSGALRHAFALLAQLTEIERGRAVDDVVQSWRGLHFRRHREGARQLRRWTSGALFRVVAVLQEAVLASRSLHNVDDPAQRALWRIATRKTRSAEA